MATVALLANGTPHPTSTRLQPPSSLAAHRDGCTTVWVGPPQKAVGGQERSNAWCVERCSQDQLSDCPTDLCQCKEEQRATRQRNSHRSSNPIPRQCEQFIASSTAQQQPWAPCARIMDRGLGFDFELAEKLGQILQLAKQQSGRPKLRALEFGSGLGLYADQLARAGHKVLAVEPQPMHTTTYDGAWPRQLEVNMFDGPGAACTNALEPFDLVYSLGAVQDLPDKLHSKVADVLGNLTDGFLVFSAARVEMEPTEYTEGSVRPGNVVPANAQHQWRAELERRGLEYLPLTSLAFQPPGCSGNPGETGEMCFRLSGVMVFAAPGAPLGRAAEDHVLSAPEMLMDETSPAAQGATPLVIDGRNLGRWWAPLSRKEAQAWPTLTAQLASRCFNGASALRSYGRILPMIDRQAKLVMAWTPRAACTLSVSIFVDHLGRLPEAQTYEGGFIHSFRQDILGPAYVVTEEDLEGTSLFKLKIVRNPYARAVSSYSHQLMTEFRMREGRQSSTIATAMADALGHSRLGQVSFVEWLRAIRKITLGPPLDYHTSLQTSEAEHVGTRVYDKVCKLETGFAACLNSVNRAAGTNLTPPRVKALDTRHFALHEHMPGDVASSAWSRFELRGCDVNSTRPTIRNSRVLPRPSDFYQGGVAGREAAAIVAELYALDFKQYDYDPRHFDEEALQEFGEASKKGGAGGHGGAGGSAARDGGCPKGTSDHVEPEPPPTGCMGWCDGAKEKKGKEHTCGLAGCAGCGFCGRRRQAAAGGGAGGGGGGHGPA